MAFEYDPKNSTVVTDKESGASISHVLMRSTDSEYFLYRYKHKIMEFDFLVWTVSEPIVYESKLGVQKEIANVAAYIRPQWPDGFFVPAR